MREWIIDIKQKTTHMSNKDRYSYILTYYWYHILIICSVLALVFIFGKHYAAGRVVPVFTCVMVNQDISTDRDNKVTEDFAKESGFSNEKIVFDSNYNFSYGDVKLSGVNESSYEKFFLQWRNEELDAVIVPESFYKHCKEMGGQFKSLENIDCGDFKVYIDNGKETAVVLVNDNSDEKLLLAFPDTGKNSENCNAFLDYLIDVSKGENGGIKFEEIIY